MELTQYRIARDDESTAGVLFRDGMSQAFTLEDQKRAEKVRGETRIPAGRYRILPRIEGGMVRRYQKRFRWHRGMLWLQDVPGFDWIYYHVRNFDTDTEGCILVGSRAVTTPGKMALLESVPSYETFYKAVIDAAEAGELWTTIIDRDGWRPNPAQIRRITPNTDANRPAVARGLRIFTQTHERTNHD